MASCAYGLAIVSLLKTSLLRELSLSRNLVCCKLDEGDRMLNQGEELTDLKEVDLRLLEQYRNERAIEFFNERWADTTDAIMFQEGWDSPDGPNGQVDHWSPIDSVALRAIPLRKVFRSITRSGERFLFVGTRLGPVVVYVAKHERQGLVMNQYSADPVMLSGFMAVPRFLDIAAVRHILGTGPRVRKPLVVPNIGDKIEAVYRHFTNPERYSLQDLGT